MPKVAIEKNKHRVCRSFRIPSSLREWMLDQPETITQLMTEALEIPIEGWEEDLMPSEDMITRKFSDEELDSLIAESMKARIHYTKVMRMKLIQLNMKRCEENGQTNIIKASAESL